MLSDLLRDRLGLTGTKIGCNEAECGACTVLIDGEPVFPAPIRLPKRRGRQILTIEGLASQVAAQAQKPESARPPAPAARSIYPARRGPMRVLHPRAAYDCLCRCCKRNPDPSDDDIRHALKDTLCRCAGYPTIIRAIQAAAHTLRTGEPIPPPVLPEAIAPLVVVGTPQHPPGCGGESHRQGHLHR